MSFRCVSSHVTPDFCRLPSVRFVSGCVLRPSFLLLFSVVGLSAMLCVFISMSVRQSVCLPVRPSVSLSACQPVLSIAGLPVCSSAGLSSCCACLPCFCYACVCFRPCCACVCHCCACCVGQCVRLSVGLPVCPSCYVSPSCCVFQSLRPSVSLFASESQCLLCCLSVLDSFLVCFPGVQSSLLLPASFLCLAQEVAQTVFGTNGYCKPICYNCYCEVACVYMCLAGTLTRHGGPSGPCAIHPIAYAMGPMRARRSVTDVRRVSGTKWGEQGRTLFGPVVSWTSPLEKGTDTHEWSHPQYGHLEALTCPKSVTQFRARIDGGTLGPKAV